jgi:hypothetical protein
LIFPFSRSTLPLSSSLFIAGTSTAFLFKRDDVSRIAGCGVRRVDRPAAVLYNGANVPRGVRVRLLLLLSSRQLPAQESVHALID